MQQARIGSGALLAVIPDPVTCFSTAKYSQKQVFRVSADSNLLIVDWITSGRHESGERWDFELYKSTNHIFLEGDQPLFLDAVIFLFQMLLCCCVLNMADFQCSLTAIQILIPKKLKKINSNTDKEVVLIMEPLVVVRFFFFLVCCSLVLSY